MANDNAVHLTPEQILKGTEMMDNIARNGDSAWVFDKPGASPYSVSGLGALFTLLQLELGITVKTEGTN